MLLKMLLKMLPPMLWPTAAASPDLPSIR